MMATRLEIHDDGMLVLNGALGFGDVPDLWDQSWPLLEAAAGDTVQVDLRGIERIDSAGLVLLLGWAGWAHRLSKSIRFLNPPQQLLRLARANNLQQMLGFKEDFQ